MSKGLIVGVLFVLSLAGAQSAGLAGRYDGVIALPNAPLEISVALRAGRPWTGTVDVPAQNITGAALEGVRVDGNAVTFAIADTPGDPTFRGTLSGGTLTGTFSQGGAQFPFALERRAALSGAERAAALERGRLLTAWFYGGDLRRLYGAFSEDYRARLSREELAAFRWQVDEQVGAETQVSREEVSRRGDLTFYTRTARFADSPLFIAVQWAFFPDGRVGAFSVGPRQDIAAPSRRLNYRTKTALQLPFAGLWTVFWGGRTLAENYHAAFPDQRFAYDFVVERGGSSFAGDGRDLSDYYCFGRPVYAPGAGTVVRAVSNLPDVPIGESETQNALGNYVVIDHGNGEFSFLAHLRQGSVRVAVGETVAAGDPIGRCGNSGNTTEPHLHYHLQTDAVFHGGAGGEGLPAQFLNYTADGQRVGRGEPIRGQVVEQ